MFTTRRHAEITVGKPYTTKKLTLASAESAEYKAGTVMLLDPTTNKLSVFKSDTAGTVANYDLYILLNENVKADKDKMVDVVASGYINSEALIFNKSEDTLKTLVNGVQIQTWLSNKFTLEYWEDKDNYKGMSV